jgi:hypothetical protein
MTALLQTIYSDAPVTHAHMVAFACVAVGIVLHTTFPCAPSKAGSVCEKGNESISNGHSSLTYGAEHGTPIKAQRHRSKRAD